jgi:hypothetical protein
MNFCRRILAGLTLLLSTAGLLLSIAAGVSVWVVKEPVTAKATRTFARVDAALDVADKGLEHVKAKLDRATERLETVKAEQQKLAKKPRKGLSARRVLARTVQRKIVPEVGDAHEKLHTVAEAAVVVNSVLDDLSNFPYLSVAGLDIDQLTAMNSRLAEVAPAAWELSRLIGEPAPAAGEDAGAQLSLVERFLKRMRALIDEYEPRLREVRQRTEELKSRTLPNITPAAVGISFVCFWIALSQVSLLAHAWSWWKGPNHNASPASRS